MEDIRRVAIVNRGEAAMRALRAVGEYRRETGTDIRTIALYTDPDVTSWFVRDADEAFRLGPATTLNAEGRRTHTYLDHGRLLLALRTVGADAVWVGWGFVAEDADFAEQCEAAGITFIGPPSEVIRRLGNKVSAKELAEKANVPVGAWSGRPVETVEDAADLAGDLGYPLLIKAASGGGGRGIRRVDRRQDLAAALASARAEAALAFGDHTVFLEQLVGAAHHVEVQVIADAHGTAWAVGVRDCSLQRRNQKILEESASVSVPHVVRERMKADAVRLCQTAGYRNAGTVEYLYDPASGSYQFMEVNTRLQVEHPVTELTTGLDLVKLQLHVACGGRLEGEPPAEAGHAIEVRLNAEDPERGFAPAPGRVEFLRMPAGPGIRVDTGIAQGDTIAPEFDAMVAKLLAWGRDRNEALARLHRALLETVVIIGGGTTNKAFLLTLLDRPEVVDGRVHIGWLDRLTRAGEHVPPHHASCLIAAAIEAYEADHAAERSRFLQSAARGRPEVSDKLGHRVELRFRGQTYPLTVYRLGSGRYRLDTGGALVDAAMDRVSTYERRLDLNGDRLKVIADVQGPTYQIELEGIPHRIERDDGGFVRSSAPAVVISLAVGVGDQVSPGDPVALIESMKMETTVHATFGGRVRRVLAAPNAQVDAGAALLQLEPMGLDRDVGGSGRVRLDLAALPAASQQEPEQECVALLRSLRSHLLGYDLDPETVRRLTYDLPALSAALPGHSRAVLALERQILGIYADLGQLSRRSPGLDNEDEPATGASPREHLLTYLRSVDRANELLPERFLNRLRRALHRYGLRSLHRTPALEEALVWMYRAFLRLPRLTPVVAAILERWLARRAELSKVLGDDVRGLLDRVVDAAEGRAPTVGDLAREVQFRLFDQPLLERTRHEVYAEMAEAMAAIERNPDRPDRDRLIERLLGCPQPLRPLLLRYGLRDDVPGMQQLALELRIRRFYGIRDLGQIRFLRRDRCVLGVADYTHEGRTVHLVATYARWAACGTVLAAMADHVAGVERDRRVIVDLTLQHDGGRLALDKLEREVRRRVQAVRFDRDLHRVDVTVTFAGDEPEHRRTSHLTFRQHDGRPEVDPLYRNLHPMVAKRVGIWRLRNFTIERLPSAEDVYLFLGTGKDNPADRRLFALAEVLDLTPVTDAQGRITALPHLERMVLEAFSAMRGYLSRQPGDRRPVRNRLILEVRPPATVPPEQWREFAHRLAPASVGLDVDVMVWGQVPDGRGRLEETVLHVENVGQHGVVVRREAPSDEPIPTLDAYRQKVVKTERRGGVYPYELVTRLTPSEGTTADFPPGEFVEHDLDEDGRLQPVDRPYGQNTANLVVGVIANRTAKVPEGMRRVIILGDPSRSLGSLAEGECRRVTAALDLAEELRVPVEWFAVSSGARIAMDSGTENMDWVAAVLRRLVEFTQAGGEVNIVVTGINVGAQPYWNAEATMLMHTRGVLIMTPASAMVLTGKEALDFSGGVSAEDNFGIGGFDRIMGPNGQGQYWAPTLGAACELLYRHYEHTYVVPGERYPRRAATADPPDRDVCASPHAPVPGSDFTCVGEVFSSERNPERKKPFDMRSVMRAVTDTDLAPLERWQRWEDAETVIVWDAHVGGMPVCLLGVESHTVRRRRLAPAGGPSAWTAGTLFPQSSRKAARALNAASGNRPAVVLANLSGFDGSPESMREWQLEYGAEIGRAITNFRGPIVFVVVSRYHGGAFVVFSKTLNEQLEIAAVQGSYASVIGGTPAAAVVFSREVRRRVEADARVSALREQVEGLPEGQVGALRAELDLVRAEVHAETIGEVADEFDAIHTIERAQRVGSVDRIIPPADLRPYIIDALQRGMARD